MLKKQEWLNKSCIGSVPYTKIINYSNKLIIIKEKGRIWWNKLINNQYECLKKQEWLNKSCIWSVPYTKIIQ